MNRRFPKYTHCKVRKFRYINLWIFRSHVQYRIALHPFRRTLYEYVVKRETAVRLRE
jgi:hypothetical protein